MFNSITHPANQLQRKFKKTERTDARDINKSKETKTDMPKSGSVNLIYFNYKSKTLVHYKIGARMFLNSYNSNFM